jgi:hypothetical protein
MVMNLITWALMLHLLVILLILKKYLATGQGSLIHQHLLRAQHKMKLQANKKCSFRSFQIGDSVYVKI